MRRPYLGKESMSNVPDRHHRRSIRMPGYDYAQPGAYFVTVCTHQQELLFGEVVGEAMVLNDAGRIVETCWYETPDHFQSVELDAFVIMPNHVHGVVMIVGARHASPLQQTSVHAHGPKLRRRNCRLVQIRSYASHQPDARHSRYSCLATQLLGTCDPK